MTQQIQQPLHSLDNQKTLKHTESYCNFCLKRIPAEIFSSEGKVYMRKECDKHGVQTTIHRWNNEEVYNLMSSFKVEGEHPSGIFIEITQQCNLECPICYNKSGPNVTWLHPNIDPEDFKEYDNIYLAGGEPTVREDLCDIIKSFKKAGKRVFIMTNGIKFSDKKYVQKLKESGLDGALFQFDGFDDSVTEKIRGERLLSTKNESLKNLTESCIPFSLHFCVLEDLDVTERAKFYELAENNRTIWMICFIPVTKVGRSEIEYRETSDLLDNLCALYQLERKDFYGPTQLLLNCDSLYSRMSRINKRHFSKCFMTSMVIIKNQEVISIRKIFDVEKLNKKIPVIQTRWQLFVFLLDFLLFENILNFFKNRYYRVYLWEFIKRLRFIFSRKMLLNPFLFLTLTRFQALENYDTECNNFCSRVYLDPRTNKVDHCCHYIFANTRDEWKI